MEAEKVLCILWGIAHAIERMDVQHIEKAPAADWTGAYKEAIRCVELVHKGKMRMEIQNMMTDTEFQMFVLRATRNYHQHEMKRMGIASENDPITKALNEAIRCVEIVRREEEKRLQENLATYLNK